ncbi:MAG: helix-turn-helix domain-containing protein [Hadesarchaea archaeon]|nr:helix-turn-helix domain-containing protein [Hadesarchaea archaeon]
MNPEEVPTKLSGLLKITATDREILALLLKSKKKLHVGEIKSQLRRSERAIRGRLAHLHRIGLVRRESSTKKTRRPAYVYFAPPVREIVRAIREEFLRNLRRIEEHFD